MAGVADVGVQGGSRMLPLKRLIRLGRGALHVFASVHPVGKSVGIAAVLGLALIAAPMPAFAQGWFWSQIPAQISGGSRAGAIRVIQVERAKGRSMFGSKAMLKRVLRRWRPEIEAAARQAKVSEALIAAIVMVESGGNHRIVSPAGAQGLGQLMPGTARRYGVKNSFDPAQNLRGSAAYISDLLKLYRNDLVLVLAAYNAGEGAVKKYSGVPPYRETRNYVPKVLSAFELAGSFCSTPPRAARRQCQFRKEIR